MNTDRNNQERYLQACALLEELERHDLYFARIMNRIIGVVNRTEGDDGARRQAAELLQEYRRRLLEVHVRIFAVAEGVPRRIPQAQIPDSARRGEWVNQSLERLDQLENYRRELIRVLKTTQGGRS